MALELFSFNIFILIVLNNERFSLLSALLITKVKPFVLPWFPCHYIKRVFNKQILLKLALLVKSIDLIQHTKTVLCISLMGYPRMFIFYFTLI